MHKTSANQQDPDGSKRSKDYRQDNWEKNTPIVMPSVYPQTLRVHAYGMMLNRKLSTLVELAIRD